MTSIQKPYNITPQSVAIDSNFINKIKWSVSGNIQTKFSIYISYNNTDIMKITNHSFSDGDLVIDTTRDSTISGIRTVTIIDNDNINISSISSLSVGDSIDKYLQDTSITGIADSLSTTTQINMPNTGSIVAGDIIEVNSEYRFVQSVNTNVSVTVAVAFTSTTANQTVKAWNKRGNQLSEYAFKIENNSSYDLFYNLPIKSILNGEEYKLSITVYDQDGNSATSDSVIFSTSTTPVVVVSPITTISNSSYNFSATYSQNENVAMKSYIAILYNSNKIKITSSGLQTSSPLEYMFSDLQNNETYYIEFQATSNKGLTASSGLVSFNVSYSAPNINLNLTAENTDNAGIKLTMSVIQIVGQVSGTVSYPDNTNIDVTNGSVYFQDGFTINSDFTLKLWIKSPKSKEDLLILNGTNGNFSLQYNAVDRKFYLCKKINNIKSYWVSDEVISDKYFVIIQQIDNQINIQAQVKI